MFKKEDRVKRSLWFFLEQNERVLDSENDLLIAHFSENEIKEAV
jgi:hypothetical protein